MQILTTRDSLVYYARERVKLARYEIEHFAEELLLDAGNAVDSCDDELFRWAARLDVWDAVITSLEKGISLENIAMGRHCEAMRLASYGSRSASVTSNLMARYRLAAYAEVLEAMGFEP
jgi:hypothetical protein